MIRLATPTTDAATPAGGARGCERVPLLCLGRRDHRAATGGPRPRSTDAVAAAQGRDGPAGGGRLRDPHAASRPGQIARVADGVVVGSAIVELVGKHGVDAPEHGPRLYPLPQDGRDPRKPQGKKSHELDRSTSATFSPSSPKKETPDNLWHKCKGCGQMTFMKELEANQHVCPHCDHHDRIGPRTERFSSICSTRAAIPCMPSSPGWPRIRSSSAMPETLYRRASRPREPATSANSDALILQCLAARS